MSATRPEVGGAPQGGVREALKKLSGESVIYGIGQVSGRAVQIVLVPILTRALLPGAYGISELTFAYLQTAALVLVLGMDSALARFFYEEPDRAARIRMASTSLLFRLATSVAVAALLMLLAGPLAAGLMGNIVYKKYVMIGAATLPFTLLVLYANDVLRVTFQPQKFIALNITWSVAVAGLSIVFVLQRHLGVAGVLYGKLLGDALTAALALVLVRHTLAPVFSRAILARMVRYGFPLVPASLAYGAMASFDRFVLQGHRTLPEVAVYGVAAKFFAVVTMGVSAFQLAYMPFAYARAQQPDAPRLYARVFAAYIGAASLGAMFVGLFAPEALRILAPPAYAAAALPAALLAFAAVAQGAYTVAGLGITLALRTPLVGWIAGGTTLMTVAANLLLTPRLGAPGAALATWLAQVTSATLAYAIAQRVYPAPYRGRRVAALGVLALLLTLGGQRFAPPGVAGIALKGAIALGYAALLWRLEILRDRGGVSHAA